MGAPELGVPSAPVADVLMPGLIWPVEAPAVSLPVAPSGPPAVLIPGPPAVLIPGLPAVLTPGPPKVPTVNSPVAPATSSSVGVPPGGAAAGVGAEPAGVDAEGAKPAVAFVSEGVAATRRPECCE